MNILIVSPGKKHSPEMAVMIGEYEKRLRGDLICRGGSSLRAIKKTRA